VGLRLSAGAFGQEEPPSAYSVDFDIHGNINVASRKLREALSALRSDLRRTGVDAGAADDAAYELVRYYHSQGYRHADVLGSVERQGGGFLLRFQISEGPRSVLVNVTFDGNQFFKSKDLEECFPWLKQGALGLGNAVFTEGVLDDGISCVITRYQLEGFYFVEVVPALSEDENAQVRVQCEVREGPRVFLARIPTFEGNSVFTEEQLNEALALAPRAPFAPRLELVLKSKIVDFYKERGYLFVKVQASRELDREAGEASLAFRIEEGPLVKIEDVTVTGNEKTYEWVLKNRIHLQKGDVYDESKVRESYRSLLRSGLFRSVTIETPRVDGSQDRVYLNVKVEEKARFHLSFLAGYGSYELLRGAIVLEDSNLFGTGHRLRLEGKGSFRGEGASATYLNPFFFVENLSHTTQGSYARREHPSFTQQYYSGESGVSYRISDQLRSSLLYRLRQSNVIDVDEDVPPELVDDVLLSSVALSFILDTRNSIVDPDRGFTGRVTVEYAGGPLGSELDFLRYTAFASYVMPLPWGLRLVTAARAGIIDRLADTDVIPIQERFFNGGEYTIRSFREDEAGPKSNGEPIGGEAFTSMNVELRFPLFVLDGLQGAVFGDTGTLTEDAKDFGGGRYFFGVGSGLRYNTPVGPFRLDFAWNPDRADGEDLFVVHFGVGYPF